MKKVKIRSMAHITGGGFYDNIPRVLAPKTAALIYKGLWPVPKIFSMIQERSRVSDKEMYRTFNMGTGIVVVVDKKDVKNTHATIKGCGLRSWTIGEIVEGKKEVII